MLWGFNEITHEKCLASAQHVLANHIVYYFSTISISISIFSSVFYQKKKMEKKMPLWIPHAL